MLMGMGDPFCRLVCRSAHTAASFNVEDIEAEVRELKSKGVKFEEYNIPSMHLKTVNSIATLDKIKSAWFKDTEGNILSITQLSRYFTRDGFEK